jgi:hypothetical protein
VSWSDYTVGKAVRKRVSGYNDGMEFLQMDPIVEKMLPADTRLLNIHAVPHSEGKRLKIGLDLTPFQQKPYIDLTLLDSSGKLVASTSIVEPVNWNLELNLHIRKFFPSHNGSYKLRVVISYPDLGEVDRRDLTIEIPSTAV